MSTDSQQIGRSSHSDPSTSRGYLTAVRRRLVGHERLLWGFVLAVCCADVLSTAYGVGHGQTEGNPVVQTALADGGFLAFLELKAAVVSFAVSVWVVMPRRSRVVVPLGLALPWGVIAVLNLAVLL